jgi:hypothetical protein
MHYLAVSILRADHDREEVQQGNSTSEKALTPCPKAKERLTYLPPVISPECGSAVFTIRG